MSNSIKRKFYDEMDSKFAAEKLNFSRRGIAGTMIPSLGLPRGYEILEAANSFGMWLALSFSSISETIRSAPDPSIAVSKHVANEAILFERVCANYEISTEKLELRAKVALMIKRAGTKACSKSLDKSESFELWQVKCREVVVQKSLKLNSRRRKPTNPKNRKLVKLPESQKMKNPKVEVVGDRKLELSMEWQRNYGKHQLEDENEKTLRRNVPKM